MYFFTRYHHTGPISSIYALREALAIVSDEGLENIQLRHYRCANKLYKGLENIGLTPFVTDITKRVPTVTTVIVPDGVIWNDVTKFLMKR